MARLQRRAVLVALLVLVVGLLSLLGHHPGDDARGRSSNAVVPPDGVPGPSPNIVLVMTDDQTMDDLRWMRQTRRLLGDGGTTFARAVSPHPLCCPARAMVLTGQYAQNNGVQHNNGPRGGYEAFDPADGVAQWFSDAGYQTALVGKYLNRYARRHGRDPGWTHWDPLVQGVYDYRDFTFYNDEEDEAVYLGHYVTRAISERTNAVVERFADDERPFLVFSWHVAPHFRYDHRRAEAPPTVERRDRGKFSRATPPSLSKPSFRHGFDRAQPQALRQRRTRSAARVRTEYRARIRSLQSVDRAVASLVETLKRSGAWEDTYVFFTSDNGYLLGEHGRMGKNLLTSEALEVPLLVAGPGVRRGQRSTVPASLTDLPATFVALAGLTPRHPLDGASLVPAMEHRSARFRDTTLVQTGRSSGDGWDYRGVLTSRYLYAVRPGDRDALLYDLKADPYQLRNRVTDPAYRRTRRELEERRRILVTCQGTECNQRFGNVPGPQRKARKTRRR